MVASVSTWRRSNICRPFLRPPKSMAKPRTRRRLPSMEPVIEANTSSIWPARMAVRVMISSAALPKVALRSPPMPARCASRATGKKMSSNCSPRIGSASLQQLNIYQLRLYLLKYKLRPSWYFQDKIYVRLLHPERVQAMPQQFYFSRFWLDPAMGLL